MHKLGRGGSLSMSVAEMRALTPCRTDAELVQALTELQTTGAADVTLRNANVTPCNATVTVTNRRLSREHKSAEGTSLRVQRWREKRARDGLVTTKKPEARVQNEKSTHTSVDVPMAPTVASTRKGECVSVEVGIADKKAQFEAENRLNFVWDQLCKLYNRPSGQARSYMELSMVAEVSRRPEVKLEVALIIAYMRKLPPADKRYFPGLSRLVEKWDEVLDRARNYAKPKAEKSILEKDLERQLAEARAL